VRSSGTRQKDKKDYERERLKRQFTLIVNQSSDVTADKDTDKGPYWN
jgi:hypothetical protein